MKVGSEYYFYQNDHLGTPQKLITISGAVVWSAKYSSFGKAQVDPASTVVNNLRFPGQYYDSETGLYYNWFRYYDPKTGRYLRIDPVGFYGLDINLYGYTWNSPLNWYDPWGLFTAVQRRTIISSWRNTGAAAGAILGFLLGGGGGALTGPGAVAAVPALAYAGAGVGAISGGIAGEVIATWLLDVIDNGNDSDNGEETPCDNNDDLKDIKPDWVKDKNTFMNWLKNLERDRPELTKSQIDAIVRQSRDYGFEIRPDPPHPGGPWNVHHLNIWDKAKVHIQVPPDYNLP